jgi:predicted enzyme related to lactoylglutathione lyase
MNNIVVWFEIPVKDLNRAIAFYSKVMDVKLTAMDMGSEKMAFFPYEPGTVSGSLNEGKDYTPSAKGTLIYLNGGEDLSVPLKRVKGAGGKIIKEKMSIGEYGFMAIFEDTEGNHVAFHSSK